MILSTMISRYNDGKILCETFNENINYDISIREKVKVFLKQKNYQNADYEIVPMKNDYYLHFMKIDCILIIIIYEKYLDKKIGKAFIIELSEKFKEFIKKEYGNDSEFDLVIDSVDKPYSYLKFDKTINLMIKNYSNNKNNKELINKLSNELYEIKGILNENIDILLKKGQNLEEMNENSKNLVQQTQNLKTGSTKLKYQLKMKKYLLFISIFFFILIIIIFKMYF